MKTNASEAVRNQSQTITDSAGRRVDVIGEAQASALAAQFALPLKQIYAEALKRSIWPRRYLRNRTSLSLTEQLRLTESHVAVIGAGGLGGTVILLLARIGIGHITIVDHDWFEETNLNRQAIATMDAIGKSKSEEAALTVRGINPAVDTTPLHTTLDAGNAVDLLAGAHVVVDALDNVSDRLVIDRTARTLGLPLVHGAVAGFNGQLTTIFPEDEGLSRLYGTKPTADDPQRPEAVLGMPAVTPLVLAGFEAMEVVKVLLDRGDILRNRLLLLDLERTQSDVFHL